MKFCSYPSGHPTCLKYLASLWVVGNGGSRLSRLQGLYTLPRPTHSTKVEGRSFLWLEPETQWASKVSKEPYINVGPLSTQAYPSQPSHIQHASAGVFQGIQKLPYPTAGNTPKFDGLSSVSLSNCHQTAVVFRHSAWGWRGIGWMLASCNHWLAVSITFHPHLVSPFTSSNLTVWAPKLESSPAKLSSGSSQIMCGLFKFSFILRGNDPFWNHQTRGMTQAADRRCQLVCNIFQA